MRPRRLLTVAATLLMLATVAGCRADDSAARTVVTAGPPCVRATASATPLAGEGTELPDLRLPCLDGAAPITLRALGRPVILNLWASWCQPCRTELPAIQRYASRMGDRITVIGVDTGDTTTGGDSVVADLGVRYPNLFDERRQLLTAVGRTALPVTLFVDGTGRIRFVYNGQPLTEDALTQLAHDHLGGAT